MDIKTVHMRVKHEGFSFLAITLPSFGKDFERSLDLGMVDRHSFAGFQRKRGLPRFLGGFLDLVFDRSSGVLLDDPSIDAILSIRQLTLMFGKIEIPVSQERESRAMAGYIQSEQEVKEFDKRYVRSTISRSDFKRVSSLLFGYSRGNRLSVFGQVDQEIRKLRDGYPSTLRPKHGPGSTADRLLGNEKFNLRAWTDRLEQILPYGEMCLPNWRYFDQLDDVDFLEPGSEMPVKVITVPKTLKAPRIIAMEPTAMQYAQQCLLSGIIPAIERDDFLSLALGFKDQIPNQEMAKRGSKYGDLATLDLSEASDRVSNQLVRDMVRDFPHLREAVDATRSRKADVLGHGVIRLSKFASMGSALCFPFEAMVFLTMIFIGIERELNTPLSREIINDFAGSVRVYGDDIIVPADYVHSVITVLEAFGSRVNRAKSFWNGKFRESCGKEFYDGHDVSIVRVRQEFPTSRKDATRVIALVELRNQLYFAGYWQTCAWLDEKIRKLIYRFPVVLPTSRVLGRHSFLGYQVEKVGPTLHNPLVKGWATRAVIPKNSLEGSGALLKSLMLLEATSSKKEEPSSVDSDHLERSGRPRDVDIILGWFQPY